MNIINVILSVLISTIGSFLAIVNFSNNKFNIKKFIIYFLIVFPTLLLANIFSDGLFKLLLVLILSTIGLYYSLFNKCMSDSLYYSIIYDIFAFISEIIISIVYVSIFNFTNESYESFSLSMFIFSVFNVLIVYLISLIKPIDKFITKFNKIIAKRQYEILYFLVIIVLLFILLIFNETNLNKEIAFYINGIITICLFIFLIYIIYNSFQKNRLENNYNEMMEYVCKYEKIINEQGKKNHEYNNQLMVIKGYSNDPKKLNEYLDLIINEHKCGQNYTIRELSYFPDGGIKGLIYHKISKMEDKGIKYYLYIDKNIKNIFEKKFDLKTYQDITKLLGVFLDNAIDATLETDKKEIEFEIKIQDNSVIINISNTFNNKNDVKQIGKKGFTTKGKGHGYGLSIVKDISKNNENIETFKDVDNDKFSQTIIIYYK